jgi:hypothetical protein
MSRIRLAGNNDLRLERTKAARPAGDVSTMLIQICDTVHNVSLRRHRSGCRAEFPSGLGVTIRDAGLARNLPE